MNELHTQIIPRKKAKQLGMKRYFTGKPCKHGHVDFRGTVDGKCMECSRMDSLKQKRANPEYHRARRRQWYIKNRSRCLEYAKKYNEKNRSHRLAYGAEWRNENREHLRKYDEENRVRRKDYHREYKKQNPEKVIAQRAKRRAAEINRSLRNQEELTNFCVLEAARQAKDMEDIFGIPFHVDHMIPLQGDSVSGLHVCYNLQVIPASLNVSKGNSLKYTEPLEWLGVMVD